MLNESESEESGNGSAIETLQILLAQENIFLTRIKRKADECCPPHIDVDQLKRDLTHGNIQNIARFFFLLEEANCTTPQAIDRFIDGHNKKVMTLIEKKDFSIRTEGELNKTIFKRARKSIVLSTISDKNAVVFAKSEIADFLFDHMSRDAANRSIETLTQSGLLNLVEDDPLEGTNRKLVGTDGELEGIYRDYLHGIRSEME